MIITNLALIYICITSYPVHPRRIIIVKYHEKKLVFIILCNYMYQLIVSDVDGRRGQFINK